jgi:hypothetical protein
VFSLSSSLSRTVEAPDKTNVRVENVEDVSELQSPIILIGEKGLDVDQGSTDSSVRGGLVRLSVSILQGVVATTQQ